MQTNQDTVQTVSTSQGTFAVHSVGATVTRWDSSAFGPLLFVSRDAVFSPGVPIRGGIPLCFPWFGVPRLPQSGAPLLGAERAAGKHGFARNLDWKFEDAQVGEDGAWVVRYSLTQEDMPLSAPPADTRPQPFRATYEVIFGEVLLDLAFTVENTGDAEFLYEDALHAYFRVEDVLATVVDGLEGAEYVDKVGEERTGTQEGAITFGSEFDRVYKSDAPVEILDEAGHRRIRIVKEDSGTTIVWNPGPQLAVQVSDLGDDEWRNFVCVEAANAFESAIVLAPGELHTTRVRYEVSAL